MFVSRDLREKAGEEERKLKIENGNLDPDEKTTRKSRSGGKYS